MQILGEALRMVRTRCYRDGVVVAEGFPIADVSDHLADPQSVVWFDLTAPKATDKDWL
jgi:magnesium transporter